MQSSSSSSSSRFKKLLLVPYNKVMDKRNLSKGYKKFVETEEKDTPPKQHPTIVRKSSPTPRRPAAFVSPAKFVPPPPPILKFVRKNRQAPPLPPPPAVMKPRKNRLAPPPPPASVVREKVHPFVAAVETGRRRSKKKAPAPPLDEWVRL